jgi:hypothetical protein
MFLFGNRLKRTPRSKTPLRVWFGKSWPRVQKLGSPMERRWVLPEESSVEGQLTSTLKTPFCACLFDFHSTLVPMLTRRLVVERRMERQVRQVLEKRRLKLVKGKVERVIRKANASCFEFVCQQASYFQSQM